MTPEELIQKKYMFISHDQNFGLMVSFSENELEDYYGIDCHLRYDAKKNNWNYHFLKTDTLSHLNFKNQQEKMKELIEELTIGARKKREELASVFLSSFEFAHDYELKHFRSGTRSLKKVYLKNTTVNGQKAEVCMHIPGSNKIQKIEIILLNKKYGGNLIRGVTHLFSWKFAKEHFKGLDEFEEYLYTKSKDRLTLLLT